MQADPIRGRTIRWTFDNGPMAKKSFEHSFEPGGTVSWRMLGGKADAKPTQEKKYEMAIVGHDVCAVSYLGSSGYTLTTVLDFRTGRLVAFASNEKELVLQSGTFEVVGASTGAAQNADHERAQ